VATVLPDTGPSPDERRAARRLRVGCRATLRTLTGDISGHLWDLSETGARIQIAHPPAAGATALLKWEADEAECSVVWATGGMCGVAFQRRIDDAVVVATAGLTRLIEEPIAALHNIPLGRKRSAQVAPAALPGNEPSKASSWHIRLARPRGSRGSNGQASVTAAEEMFFFGSPLAHVLAYEAHLSSSPMS
jgi:hypothetical protein